MTKPLITGCNIVVNSVMAMAILPSLAMIHGLSGVTIQVQTNNKTSHTGVSLQVRLILGHYAGIVVSLGPVLTPWLFANGPHSQAHFFVE